MKRPLALVLVLWAAPLLQGQADPGTFSGLKSQLEQSLQSALAQTTVLKPRWSLPSPSVGSVVRSAVSDEGRALVAVLSADRRAIQVWAANTAQPWGDPLTLAGRRIEQFSVIWGPGQSAWIAWSGSDAAAVATWSGLAWVNVGLPEPNWSGPLFWTRDLRLWGKQTNDLGPHLTWARTNGRRWEASDRTGGMTLAGSGPYEVREVGGRTLLALLGNGGGLFENRSQDGDQWLSLGFPDTLDELPEWGSFGTELVVLANPGPASTLWTLPQRGGWQRRPDAPALAVLGSSPALLMGASGKGALLALEQFDGDVWRVPLPLDPLGSGRSDPAAVQFLPPPGKAKSGLLVLGASGWELP